MGRRCVLGPFSKTCDPLMIEAMGDGGMDFVILDLEHGPNDISTLGSLIRAAESRGMLPIVRVGNDDQVGRALDLGAGGIQMPHVNSAERAQQGVELARFAPKGKRGVCRYVRAAHSGAMDRDLYFRQANDALVIVQVEGREGVEHLPRIIEVAGVDIVFVGVYDLSQAIGRIGQVDHPEVKAMLQNVARQCAAHDVACGTFVESAEHVRQALVSGMRYLSYGVDVGLMATACRQVAELATPDHPSTDANT